MLFTKNIPHVHEKIFLSVDYASLKSCQRVCKAWRELLTSEPFQRKVESVYPEEVKRERILREENLLRFAKEGDEEKVGFLLAIGVDPNCKITIIKIYGEDKCMPLIEAAGGGHAGVVRLLLDAGADPGKSLGWGVTPLSMAVCRGHLSTANVLLDSMTDLNKAGVAGSLGHSLQLATEHANFANPAMVKWVKLLLDAGADPNNEMRELSGVYVTPLMKASEKGNTEVVKLLLDAGADPNKKTTAPYSPQLPLQLPLILALENGHEGVAELLRAAGGR